MIVRIKKKNLRLKERRPKCATQRAIKEAKRQHKHVFVKCRFLLPVNNKNQ
jgi:hypothetical protein